MSGSGADPGLRGLIVLLVVLPVPGEEFVEPVLRRVGDPAEDIGEPSLGIDVVEPGGTDQRIHRRRAHAAAVRAGEQPRSPVQGNTSERPLGRIMPISA